MLTMAAVALGMIVMSALCVVSLLIAANIYGHYAKFVDLCIYMFAIFAFGPALGLFWLYY